MKMMIEGTPEDMANNSILMGKPLEDFGWENGHLGAKWVEEQGTTIDLGMNPPGTSAPQPDTWEIETYGNGKASTSIANITIKEEKN
ncbi:hypothetical protein M5689_006595 [Euphorbia peplus]|nr:hypothetical protein M5689_006595 [Euphorbia peplus]